MAGAARRFSGHTGGTGLVLWRRGRAVLPRSLGEFQRPHSPDERGDLIAAYGRRLFSGNPVEETRYARLWTEWENALASVETRFHYATPVDYAHAFARLENHYFANGCFLERDGLLLDELWRMAGVRGTIVQGQYDMICPPVSAWMLHRAWPGSHLRMVPMAGHALSEPGITAALVQVMDELRSADLRL